MTTRDKLIEPLHPKIEGARRSPIKLVQMCVAQQCFGLSDEDIEDAVYDSQSIRGFVGSELCRELAPDATTLLKFRHLLKANALTLLIFDTINAHLVENGSTMRNYTIDDATLIAAPSTKNKEGKRDPKMHQSKKGNDWHFGMKAHISAGTAPSLGHTVVGMGGNVSDVTQARLYANDRAAFVDVCYQRA